MPYEAMGPFPHLGLSGDSPQQEMRGLMGGMLVVIPLCAKLHQVAFSGAMAAFIKYCTLIRVLCADFTHSVHPFFPCSTLAPVARTN